VIEQYVGPEELKRLLSTLLVVVLAIAIAILFASIVVPGLRNANAPLAGPPVSPPEGESGWLDPTEVTPQKGYVIPPVDPATILTATPALLERGKAVFARNCASCHGIGGRGDGPASATLVPRPRDFTKPDGWINGFRIEGIFKTLLDGIPGSAMTSWDFLPARDRMALVHFVQSLGAFPHGPEEPTVLAAFAKQFASASERVPNRIPVSLAMTRLEAEEAPVAPLAVPEGPPGDRGSALLRAAIVDGSRAALTLARSPRWRETPAALAAAVVPGAPGDGFAVSVATLDADDWGALHRELLRAAPR
jgi:mono/diheme cytochrome c family protein